MPSATVIPMHSALEPIAFLLGTWRGEGEGAYPTIESFRYGEEVTFSHVGKPFLAYSQRTWSLSAGTPMHSETGFWRPLDGGRVEAVLAHPFGAGEIQEGTVKQTRIELRSKSVVLTSTAKVINAVARTFEVDDDVLRYTVEMAAVRQPLQYHLSAELRRA